MSVINLSPPPLDFDAVQGAMDAAEARGDMVTLRRFYMSLTILQLNSTAAYNRLAKPAPRQLGLDGEVADRLLTPKEGAVLMGPTFTARYIYKHASKLPFVRRSGRRMFCSEAGIRAWKAALPAARRW